MFKTAHFTIAPICNSSVPRWLGGKGKRVQHPGEYDAAALRKTESDTCYHMDGP